MAEEIRKKILIIDDNQDLVTALSQLLSSKGYFTIAAFDAMFGISLAHKENIDLILLDLGLPAGGGFHVLDNLKKSVNTSQIPVLVLTASEGEELRVKALNLGAAVYLNKPFEPEDLLTHITNNLK